MTSMLCVLAFALPAEAALSLSMDQAVARALDRNPSVRLLRTEVDRARGLRRGAEPWLPQNPALSFDIGPRDQGAGPNTSYALRLEQPVEIFGQRGARLRAADEQIGLAQARVAALEAELRARVRIQYVGALLAQRRVEFARQRVANAERTLESARLRAKAGAASEIEERLAEAELGRARLGISEAELRVQQAHAALRELLDLPAGTPITLTTTLSAPPVKDVPLERRIARARSRRRDLLALRQEGRAIDAEIERLRAERLPAIALVFSAQRDSPVESWYAGGIAFNPPLWRRNQGPLLQAAADRERSRIAIATTETQLERELTLLDDLERRRREELLILENTVLRAATRTRDLIQEGWRAGKFDLFRVLTVERELVDAQLGWLEAMALVWTTQIELERSAGEGEMP